jgi:hypothetical protein
MNELSQLLTAAGLDPRTFRRPTFAPAVHGEPAIAIGLYHEATALVRQDALHGALAILSLDPRAPLSHLTSRESERLRAEALVADGNDAPVGQKAVLDSADPKPYTPPLPSHREPAPPEDDDTEPSEIVAHESPCGNPECIVFEGPDGVSEVHVDGCPAA